MRFTQSPDFWGQNFLSRAKSRHNHSPLAARAAAGPTPKDFGWYRPGVRRLVDACAQAQRAPFVRASRRRGIDERTDGLAIGSACGVVWIAELSAYSRLRLC